MKKKSQKKVDLASFEKLKLEIEEINGVKAGVKEAVCDVIIDGCRLPDCHD